MTVLIFPSLARHLRLCQIMFVALMIPFRINQPGFNVLIAGCPRARYRHAEIISARCGIKNSRATSPRLLTYSRPALQA